jgi:cell division septation protein DedD
MQANEALDHLLADEISGRAPAPSPASSKKENKPQAIPSDAFYLQVASFDNDGDAKNEIRRLRALDSALFKDRKFVLQKSESSTTKKRIFKVLVGFFPTANAATQFKTKLKAHKVDGFVVKSKVPSKKV